MYELKNYMEDVVYQTLQDFLSKNQISCSCERCQADIMTLALNQLPPRYYSSSEGQIMMQLKVKEDLTLVMTEVIRAAQMISDSPSHPIN